MTRDDLVRFASRDWIAIANGKARYWADHKRAMSPAEVLRLADDLRRHVSSLRADWPTESERAADRSTHGRVTEALRAVASIHPR